CNTKVLAIIAIYLEPEHILFHRSVSQKYFLFSAGIVALSFIKHSFTELSKYLTVPSSLKNFILSLIIECNLSLVLTSIFLTSPLRILFFFSIGFNSGV